MRSNIQCISESILGALSFNIVHVIHPKMSLKPLNFRNTHKRQDNDLIKCDL